MRLYSDLAAWWPLVSPPSHYGEEAIDILPDMRSAPDARLRTVLELGCGGGSLAWHLKPHFVLTLTDVSAQMLAVSRAANPECEHVQGDMRTLDLGRTFDLVLIHDAIMYLVDAESVRAALATANRHCRPGGGLIVMPDCVRETFAPETGHGGEDGSDGRGLRYLEWTWDPDPTDDTFVTAWAFLLREADGRLHVEQDLHRFGLFPRASWARWLDEAGFDARSRIDPWQRDIFIARKRP
jgi:SAM-dependent methyltransferase